MPTDPNRHPTVRSLFDQPLAKPAIPCTITPIKPDLNFSFRFQAGYFATWPLKNYQGSDSSFFILTRITPLNPEGDPAYFTQAFRMRDIPSSSRNHVQVDGAYFFGEGEYSMDLILVDQAARVCRKQWNIDVKPPGGGQLIKPAQAPGSVQPAVLDPWDGALKDDGPPRRLTVLMHVAPLYFSSNQMHAYDRAMLLSSLLAVLRQTSFTQVKLVALSLDQQSELFRQERFDASGWSKLVAAMHSLQLGTVSYQTLQQRSGHLDLLTGLVQEELEAEHPPDVILFLGPTARQNEKLRVFPASAEAVRPLFVYFEFKPFWRRGYEFPDIFFHLTRSQSGKTFRIHSPLELVRALQHVEKLAASHRPLDPSPTLPNRSPESAPALH